MTRAMLALCAGSALALFVAGCANSFQLFAQGDIPTGNEVVPGELNIVAASTQSKLARLGFNAVLTSEGEALHLTSTTKNGARFTLILTRERTAQGEQTRIKLKWNSGYDRDAVVQIFAELTPKAGH